MLGMRTFVQIAVVPRASSTASAEQGPACNEPPRCRLLLGPVRIKILLTRDIDVAL